MLARITANCRERRCRHVIGLGKRGGEGGRPYSSIREGERGHKVQSSTDRTAPHLRMRAHAHRCHSHPHIYTSRREGLRRRTVPQRCPRARDRDPDKSPKSPFVASSGKCFFRAHRPSRDTATPSKQRPSPPTRHDRSLHVKVGFKRRRGIDCRGDEGWGHMVDVDGREQAASDDERGNGRRLRCCTMQMGPAETASDALLVQCVCGGGRTR